MLLSDKAIRGLLESGRLEIDPIYPDTVRENGVDLRIGEEVAFPTFGGEVIDLRSADPERHFVVREIPDEGLMIPGNTSLLLVTQERVRLPEDVAGLCALRSTLARWGFLSAPTLIDAGFEGQLTIEVAWTRPSPVKIYRGIRFLHVVFFRLDGRSSRPYSGFYQGQMGVSLPKSLGGEVEGLEG